MRQYLDSFIRSLATKAPRTAQTYQRVVEALLSFADAVPIDRILIESFLDRPRRHGAAPAPATRNQELAALHAFYVRAQEDDPALINPTLGMPFLREPSRDVTFLTLDEMRDLFRAAARAAVPEVRARDLAILGILGQAGLRVHEIANLNVDQLDVAGSNLLEVRGKGGTVATVPLSAPALVLVSHWLRKRPSLAAVDEHALFVSRTGRRLSIRGYQLLLVRLRAEMGTQKRVTPHSLRHSTATLALMLETDLATVADLLRHSDVNITRRYYLHLVDQRTREAVRRLAVAVPPELLAGLVSPDGNRPTVTDTDADGLDVQHGLDEVRGAA